MEVKKIAPTKSKSRISEQFKSGLNQSVEYNTHSVSKLERFKLTQKKHNRSRQSRSSIIQNIHSNPTLNFDKMKNSMITQVINKTKKQKARKGMEHSVVSDHLVNITLGSSHFAPSEERKGKDSRVSKRDLSPPLDISQLQPSGSLHNLIQNKASLSKSRSKKRLLKYNQDINDLSTLKKSISNHTKKSQKSQRSAKSNSTKSLPRKNSKDTIPRQLPKLTLTTMINKFKQMEPKVHHFSNPDFMNQIDALGSQALSAKIGTERFSMTRRDRQSTNVYEETVQLTQPGEMQLIRDIGLNGSPIYANSDFSEPSRRLANQNPFPYQGQSPLRFRH